MLGHIYYATGLLILISIIAHISRFKKIQSVSEWVEKFKSVTGKDPQKSDFRSKEELNLSIGISILSLLEFMWALGGLLTGSWYIFLSLFIYSIIIGLPHFCIYISYIIKYECSTTSNYYCGTSCTWAK